MNSIGRNKTGSGRLGGVEGAADDSACNNVQIGQSKSVRPFAGTCRVPESVAAVVRLACADAGAIAKA